MAFPRAVGLRPKVYQRFLCAVSKACSCNRQEGPDPPASVSKPRISSLDRIGAAIQLTQIGQSAQRQPVCILLAGFEQRGNVLRHLGACLGTCLRGAVHQEIVGQHDTIDGGFHLIPALQTCSPASNFAMALLASLILLNSPRWNRCTTIWSRRSFVPKASGMAPLRRK